MCIDCSNFENHIDDILDNTASVEERKQFFAHIAECPQCKKEYEFYKTVKSSLRESSPVLDDSFTSAVMEKVEALPEKKKTLAVPFMRIARIATPIAASIILCFAIIFGMSMLTNRQNQGVEEALKAESQQDYADKLITENEADYITENYVRYLFNGEEIPDYGTYSEESILDILSKTVDGYVNDEYSYIIFMTVSELDNLNMADKTMYMPRTNNGDILLFTTHLSQKNLISAVGEELSDYFVIDGSKNAAKALIVVRLAPDIS